MPNQPLSKEFQSNLINDDVKIVEQVTLPPQSGPYILLRGICRLVSLCLSLCILQVCWMGKYGCVCTYLNMMAGLFRDEERVQICMCVLLSD